MGDIATSVHDSLASLFNTSPIGRLQGAMDQAGGKVQEIYQAGKRKLDDAIPADAPIRKQIGPKRSSVVPAQARRSVGGKR